MRFRLHKLSCASLLLLASFACATPEDGFTIRFRNGAQDTAASSSGVQERILAVRADGSKVQQFMARRPGAWGGETVLPGSRWKQVLDRGRGVQVSVHPHNQTKITVPAPSLDEPAGPGCADSEGLLQAPGEPAEPILGYPVVRLAGQRALPGGGALLVQEWRAAALACAPLRTASSFRLSDGTLSGHHEEEAESVVLGPPDPTLFAVPEHYVEQGSLLERARGGAM